MASTDALAQIALFLSHRPRCFRHGSENPQRGHVTDRPDQLHSSLIVSITVVIAAFTTSTSGSRTIT